MNIEKFEKLGKHILLAFIGIIFFIAIEVSFQVVRAVILGIPNYFNTKSFENTLYFILIMFIIVMTIDAAFILLELFGADSLFDFIKEYLEEHIR